MHTTRPAVLVLLFGLALALAYSGHSHADPSPALDRQLVERLVRAEEAQAHQLEELTRAVERLKR